MTPTSATPTPVRSLHLLRHAKSGWDDPSLRDHARPLASRGVAAATALRRHLAEVGFTADLVLCSTAERTRQTWAGVAAGVAGDPEVRFLDEIYEASADTLLALLRGCGDAASVLLVGHNPATADLALGLLADPDSRAAQRISEKYPTGALASFAVDSAWGSLGYGRARLQSFVRPRDLPPG